jgi:uncharacterized protein
VSRSERIVTLDILRGIALFAMILVHFHQRMEIPAKGVEDLVGWVIWMGVETKSWAMFAFLFGAGFAILMRRAEARGLKVVPLFLRRMLALAAFGVAVELLFGFSILFEYAFWGVPLLFVRSLPTRALLVLAFLSATLLSVYSTFSPYQRSPNHAALTEAEQQGTFREAVVERAKAMTWTWTRPRALIPGSSFVLFILGLLSIRHGLFTDPAAKRRTITAAMVFGLVSWTLAWFVLPKFPFIRGFGIISDRWLALTYIGAITLLLAYRPAWKERLRSFAITGRMALTNYVLQAAILSWLASGYGLGLKMRPYYVLPATILLFLILVLLSTFWLARFPYGPLERVWRSFTLWQTRGEA